MKRWHFLALALILEAIAVAGLILALIAITSETDAFTPAPGRMNSFYSASVGPRKLIPKQTQVLHSYKATVTAYTVGDGSGYYAADGTRVYFGMLACPYSLAFGAKIKFSGLYEGTTFTCHDRSATREGLFDIWVSSFDEAYKIGRRTVTVTILK